MAIITRRGNGDFAVRGSPSFENGNVESRTANRGRKETVGWEEVS